MNITKTLAALACAGATLPAAASLQAFYTFEGTLGNAASASYAGTATNGPTFAAGYQGQGIAFQAAANQYVTFTGLDINTSAMPQVTFGGWFKTNGNTPIVGVLSHDDQGYDRTIDIDARGGATGWSAFRGDGVVYGAPAALDTWTFVAVRHDQATGAWSLFVDGTQVDATGVSFGPGLGSLVLGRNPCCDAPFDGVADNVFVFDETLSDARIAQIRAGGAAAILAVPEPASWALFGLGAAGLALARRRG
ncbi:MAG: LamG domain-containing protein [Aquabacterium sp.]|jgi:hypothetical protein|nr:MAG: LamG domain-containing protein [Aquabacterium sp.]